MVELQLLEEHPLELVTLIQRLTFQIVHHLVRFYMQHLAFTCLTDRVCVYDYLRLIVLFSIIIFLINVVSD